MKLYLLSTWLIAFSGFAGASGNKGVGSSLRGGQGEGGEGEQEGGKMRELQGGCSSTRCGSSWSEANGKCGTTCAAWPNPGWDACPNGESCFANMDTSLSCCSNSGATGGCSSIRCGTSWSDANSRCGTTCAAWPDPGWDACGSGESCFANMDTSLSCCSSSGGGSGSSSAGGSFSVTSPPKVLSVSEVQAALDVYNSFWGENVQADQSLVDTINEATTDTTKGWTIYRQLAFVAQTIWESGGYQYLEERAATEYPYSTRGNYQDCDWNAQGIQYPNTGKYYYGRGYLQLSWCANYKAYGAGLMINGDPDFLYNNPEQVATPYYAMLTASYGFQTRVHDTTGQFGDTTNDINGPIECSSTYNGNAPERRYQIFDGIASYVGLTGYSPAGC